MCGVKDIAIGSAAVTMPLRVICPGNEIGRSFLFLMRNALKEPAAVDFVSAAIEERFEKRLQRHSGLIDIYQLHILLLISLRTASTFQIAS
jgi:hypothetical protein